MTMQVTAAVARTAGGDFTLETVDLDDPRPDEIRVRIHAVGVCHTDLVAREGAMPFALPAVLGHEGAGVVESVGAAVTKVMAVFLDRSIAMVIGERGARRVRWG